MNALLYFIALAPLAAYLGVLLLPSRAEKAISRWTIGMALAHLAAILSAIAVWLYRGRIPWTDLNLSLYETEGYQFIAAIHLDYLAAVFLLLGAALFSLVAIYSSVYMHREKGYARFFANIWFFYMGYTVTVVAGNYETLFAGWEVLGVSSFFLIAFYRDRYLPVKNALKVVSIYRVADIFLLLAIWICHHQFGKSASFAEWKTLFAQGAPIIREWPYTLVIPGLFLSVAAVKSAQLPFSSWLPRAMEGPTTSSAIFYGSLYVHIGLFLMMRIEPFWADNLFIRVIMGLMGGCTALVATAIGRVQSSVKTQIAYSSSVQIGLMFIELALGWETLALVHFAGNALLRSYQLLVSPSVMNYLIHEQFYHFERPKDRIANTLTGRLRNTVLILSVKEWNLDRAMFRYLWSPFKALGRGLSFLDHGWGALIPVAVFALGLASIFSTPLYELMLQARFGTVAAGMSLMLTLHAFAERSSAIRGWLFLVLSQLFVVMAVGFNEQLPAAEVMLYLSGVLVAGTTGYLALKRFDRIEDGHDLQGHYGHVYEHPKIGLAFLLSALGIAGFPLTPTFIGIDLVLTHVHTSQYVLVTMLALSFIFLEISALRIYSRIFLGPHAKAYHEIAFKNS